MEIIRKIKYQMKWFLKFFVVILKNIVAGKNSFLLCMTPEHENLGDHAIALAELEFFKTYDPSKKVLEIPYYLMTRHLKLLSIIIGNRDIYISGGGSIGTLWIECEQVIRKIILVFHNNRIVIFPQTVYFDNTSSGKAELRLSQRIYNNHPDLWLCTREEVSFRTGKEIFNKIHVILVPDMVPYLKGYDYTFERKGALLCLRKDKEKVLSDQDENVMIKTLSKYFKTSDFKYTDTILDHCIRKVDREIEFTNKIREFARARIVITDRLHGMIFAALAGTPCIAISNCNQKVKGVYQWIKENKYVVYLEDINLLDTEVKRLLQMKNNRYQNRGLLEKYQPLLSIIEGKDPTCQAACDSIWT